MSAVATGWSAGRNDWRAAPVDPEINALQARYSQRWLLYTGELFGDRHTNPYLSDPRIYRNTTLLWKHHEAVVNFYASVIYQGDLSTDGKSLPDGTKGAIPIDPQLPEPDEPVLDDAGHVVTKTPNGDRLQAAIAELWSAWNWRQQMSLRPMYGAALGDVLTELVDDVGRGFVFPQIVWPGRVVEIELDYVGNVMSYALEYSVTETDERRKTSETYTYRKEVDKQEFRYYKNGDPFDYYREGSVVPNPYGFVPAIWDRHRIAWGERGASATDGTRQAVMQINSIFSHAFDFQRKAFFAPIIVSGKLTNRDTTTVQLSAPPANAEPSALAKQMHFLETDNDKVTIEQAQFDVGKTLEMIQDLREGIEAENPEGRFYSELRSMTQVTAPGAERLMGDVKARVDLARAGYDAQTVKLFQMALSICGFRANSGDWTTKVGPDGVVRRVEMTRRQKMFLPYSLDSYHRGEMDFGISSRPLVIPTESERIEIVALKESLETAWGLEEIGIEPSEAARIIAEKAAANALTVESDFGSTDIPAEDPIEEVA